MFAFSCLASDGKRKLSLLFITHFFLLPADFSQFFLTIFRSFLLRSNVLFPFTPYLTILIIKHNVIAGHLSQFSRCWSLKRCGGMSASVFRGENDAAHVKKLHWTWTKQSQLEQSQLFFSRRQPRPNSAECHALIYYFSWDFLRLEKLSPCSPGATTEAGILISITNHTLQLSS